MAVLPKGLLAGPCGVPASVETMHTPNLHPPSNTRPFAHLGVQAPSLLAVEPRLVYSVRVTVVWDPSDGLSVYLIKFQIFLAC